MIVTDWPDQTRPDQSVKVCKWNVFVSNCEIYLSQIAKCIYLKLQNVQSGRSSLAKHGGAYFSAVYGFMKDLIAAPGPYENQEC